MRGSLGRSGLFDWLIQRLTAIILGVYIVFWIFYFSLHSEIQYTQWKALFSGTELRIITLLVLISLFVHAWIGIWTVITDYLTFWVIRYLAQAFFIFAFLYCLFVTFSILWGF